MRSLLDLTFDRFAARKIGPTSPRHCRRVQQIQARLSYNWNHWVTLSHPVVTITSPQGQATSLWVRPHSGDYWHVSSQRHMTRQMLVINRTMCLILVNKRGWWPTTIKDRSHIRHLCFVPTSRYCSSMLGFGQNRLVLIRWLLFLTRTAVVKWDAVFKAAYFAWIVSTHNSLIQSVDLFGLVALWLFSDGPTGNARWQESVATSNSWWTNSWVVGEHYLTLGACVVK